VIVARCDPSWSRKIIYPSTADFDRSLIERQPQFSINKQVYGFFMFSFGGLWLMRIVATLLVSGASAVAAELRLAPMPVRLNSDAVQVRKEFLGQLGSDTLAKVSKPSKASRAKTCPK
jgi:hypothetical protein